MAEGREEEGKTGFGNGSGIGLIGLVYIEMRSDVQVSDFPQPQLMGLLRVPQVDNIYTVSHLARLEKGKLALYPKKAGVAKEGETRRHVISTCFRR